MQRYGVDGTAAEIDAETAARAGAPTTHPSFDAVVRMVWRLRQPDGCPWDKVQTHESIARDLIGEAYEALETIADQDPAHLKEELGDLLEQILLQAQIAADQGEFDIDDVCRELDEKLVRRHPHVFGDAAAAGAVDSSGAVQDIWDKVKQQEREQGLEPEGLLDSIPRSLPALMQAQKISKRAAKAGFDWPDVDAVWDQVREERQEFLAEAPGSARAEEEFGDILFSLVNVARMLDIDAEQALERSNKKFRRRWSAMEELARQSGRDLADLDVAQQNELWDQVKAGEKNV